MNARLAWFAPFLLWATVATVATVAMVAHAAAPRSVQPPDMGFAPVAGSRVPLDLPFRDDDGRLASLRDLSGDRPMILVPGYYRCPNLCSTVMDGVLESLAQARLTPQAWRVVAFSLDSHEDASLAAAKKRSYGALLAAAGGELHMLTGDAASINALLRAIGMRVAPDAAAQQIAHPTGFLVLTPDGRIAQVFDGVRFDPAAVRAALWLAAEGKSATPVERLLLRCMHFDPRTGLYTLAVLDGIRLLFLGAFTALAGRWAWSRRRRPSQPPSQREAP